MISPQEVREGYRRCFNSEITNRNLEGFYQLAALFDFLGIPVTMDGTFEEVHNRMSTIMDELCVPNPLEILPQ